MSWLSGFWKQRGLRWGCVIMRELTWMTQERASSWRCYVQVDQERQRVTELLKESEDSREALVKEVCLQLFLTTFAHRNKPLERKQWTAASLERIRQPYVCTSTCPLILRWKTCTLSWWIWGKRRQSFKAPNWKPLGMQLSHVLTTSTGRWEEVDHIGQVMNIWLSEQRGAMNVLPSVFQKIPWNIPMICPCIYTWESSFRPLIMWTYSHIWILVSQVKTLTAMNTGIRFTSDQGTCNMYNAIFRV